MKKVLIPLVVVVVVAAAVVYLMQSQSSKQTNNGQKSLEQQTKDTFDPKNPNFVLGSVVKASASEIEFKSGSATDVAKISSSTKLVKQTGKNNDLVDATIADFKAGKLIVVYFSGNPQGGTYTAEKIQIISQ